MSEPKASAGSFRCPRRELKGKVHSVDEESELWEAWMAVWKVW
jgi:hypothetical protein